MSANVPFVTGGDAGITAISTTGKRYGLFEPKAHASGRAPWILDACSCHAWQRLGVLKRSLDLQFAEQISSACRTSSRSTAAVDQGGLEDGCGSSQCHQSFRAFASAS